MSDQHAGRDDTIYAAAIHNRARAARAEAALAAEHLRNALLTWLANDCPACYAADVSIMVPRLAAYSPAGLNNLFTKQYDQAMAQIQSDNYQRRADLAFREADQTAQELTRAAQTIQYRPTL